MRTQVRNFRNNRAGNIAIIFGFAILPILGFVGGAVDYGRSLSVKSHLQNAVDAAALAGAAMNTTSVSSKKSLAHKVFDANIAKMLGNLTTNANISVNDPAVTVSANISVPTTLLAVLKIPSINAAATATATRQAGPPICVLALHETTSRAINIHGSSAAISAVDCGVHANSSDPVEALYGNSSTTSTAELFCAKGGVSGSSFSPAPRSGCPLVLDPYKDLPKPAISGCTFTNLKISKASDPVTLTPGTYCGGLAVQGGDVTLQPGIYVIKDGPLDVKSTGSVIGTDVMFYFTGIGAELNLSGQAKVSLWAPLAGIYAGLVFMQDEFANVGATNRIAGQGGIDIVGTLYFPTQSLVITGSGDFGANSPYMAIVADTFEFSGNGTMFVQLDEEKAGFDARAPSSVTNARLIK